MNVFSPYLSSLGIFTFLLDRLTKWLVFHYLAYPWHITSWMKLEKTFNRGIVWGAFNDESTIIFIMITLCILLCYSALSYFFMRFVQARCEMIGYTLILAGGMSNIIDRFIYHGVVDFITCYYAGYCWPTFNIADIAIVAGAGLIFVHIFTHEYKT